MIRPGVCLAVSLCILCGDIRAQSRFDIERIAASPSTFEGQRVTITAYLKFGDDQHALFPSLHAYEALDAAAADDPAWKRCLTIWNYRLWRKELKLLRDSTVTITGVVRTVSRKFGEVHWDCSDTGVEIEAIR